MRERLHFIEWLKAAGMLAIIYGHTSGHALLNPTLPVNFKQVGVVFFVFATGYLLANETRPWKRVFFNRLFELFLFGLLISIVVSIIGVVRNGDPNESNYLPFALGANVLVNAFPANPSLWYIGTYIHLLLLWALLLRFVPIRLWTFAVIVPAEIAVRLILMRHAGDFVAYQLFTNWTSILLLGMYMGRQSVGDCRDRKNFSSLPFILGLAVVIALWAWIADAIGVSESNPFGRLQFENSIARDLGTSISVSAIYLAFAILGFATFRRLSAGRITQFFGRNSMICFIIHMPLIYAVSPWLYGIPGVDTPGLFRLGINLLLFYVGTCVLSEIARNIVKPGKLRDAIESTSLARRWLA